jgi:hypothetical protein
MNKQVNRLLYINAKFFPLLATLTFILLFAETYMYIGFIRKFLYFDSRYFLIVALSSAVLNSMVEKNPEEERQLIKKFYSLNILFLPFILIAYFFLQVLENINYPNYVFTVLHLQPQNLFYVVIFSGLLVVINGFRKELKNLLVQLFSKKDKTYFKLSKFIIISLFFYFLINNSVATVDRALTGNINILSNLSDDYDSKMGARWGSLYDYMLFVDKHTVDGSVIVIPPQESPWLDIGNGGLINYFVYPKTVVGGLYDALPDTSYDYVLIARGNWPTESVERYGWPKVFVKAEKIWYFDYETQQIEEFYGDYYPEDEKNKNAWGLIKVYKE